MRFFCLVLFSASLYTLKVFSIHYAGKENPLFMAYLPTSFRGRLYLFYLKTAAILDELAVLGLNIHGFKKVESQSV